MPTSEASISELLENDRDFMDDDEDMDYPDEDSGDDRDYSDEDSDDDRDYQPDKIRRFSQSSGASLRCRSEDLDASYMYEPISSSPAEGKTKKAPPADDTPEDRAEKKSNVPQAARERLRVKAGSFDCLIIGESYPSIQVAHIIPRTANDRKLMQIEYVRGERYKEFHVHSSNNLVCLRSDIHGEFDGAGWCLIPEQTILDELLKFCRHQKECDKDHFQRLNYKELSFMKTPAPRVFRYRFHPLESRLESRTSIFRRLPLDPDEEPYALNYITIKYPYKDFFVYSHIDPLLVVINAGPKLGPLVPEPDAKDVQRIFDIVRRLNGTEEWQKEGIDYTHKKRNAAKPAPQSSPLKTRSKTHTSSHSHSNITLPSDDNGSGRSFGTGSQGIGGAPSATDSHRSKRKRMNENREAEEHDASERGVPELITDSSSHSPASMSKISKDFQEGITGERLSCQGDYNFVSEWLARQTGGLGMVQEEDGHIDDEQLIAYAKEPSVSWQDMPTSPGRLYLP